MQTFERETRKFVASILDFFFKKNDDYGQKEPLSNFYDAAERLNISPLKVWAVYFDKHMQAVESYIANGKVESESIESRIQDCIGYLLLLRALIKDQEDQEPVVWNDTEEYISKSWPCEPSDLGCN